MTAPLLITGASGYTGRRLVRRLLDRGDELRLLMRPTSDRSWLDGAKPEPEIAVGNLDDGSGIAAAMADVRRVIHLAHIRYAGVVAAQAAAPTQRVIFVSSLRALSTVPCQSVAEVLQGEQEASRLSGAIILRPSMIYGPGDDRNLSRLAGWLQRHRWLPVIGAGCYHQPVHVDDVVEAIVAAIDGAATGIYAIAGPTAMPYADLVAKVGSSVGVKPWQVPVPAGLLIAGLRVWHGLRLPAPVEVAQVQRLLEDKVYDITPARQQLAFSPRTLHEGLQGGLHSDEAHPCH